MPEVRKSDRLGRTARQIACRRCPCSSSRCGHRLLGRQLSWVWPMAVLAAFGVWQFIAGVIVAGILAFVISAAGSTVSVDRGPMQPNNTLELTGRPSWPLRARNRLRARRSGKRAVVGRSTRSLRIIGNRAMKPLIALSIAIAASSALAQDPCARIGYHLVQLIATPEKFHERTVQVTRVLCSGVRRKRYLPTH
jgi:hypothetical protein